MKDKEYERIFKVFNSMFDYIENNILKEGINKAEMVADFKEAESAVIADNWVSQVEKQDGIFLKEKKDFLERIDKMRPLINKVEEIKTFW